MDTVDKLCCEFKVLRQKKGRSIDYSLKECVAHSFECDLSKLWREY